MVSPERAGALDIPCAAHGGHFGAKGFGDLDGERAHPARCAIDQHLLPRLDFSKIAQTLQRGDSRGRDRRRFFERDVGWFWRDRFTHGHVIGIRSVSPAEDFIAGLEIRDLLAGRLDHARKIRAQPCVFRSGKSADDAGKEQAGHGVPLRHVHGGRAHPD